MVDGATQCIKLVWCIQSAIDADLHNIVRMKKGCSCFHLGGYFVEQGIKLMEL